MMEMLWSTGSIWTAGAIGLIAIGLAGVVLSRSLFRIILAIAIAEAGANLLLVIAGFKPEAVAPIVTEITQGMLMVDPIPQAMVLTAIVIGVGIQALALSLAIQVKNHYGSLGIRAVYAQMQQDISNEAQTGLDRSLERPLGGRNLSLPTAQDLKGGETQ